MMSVGNMECLIEHCHLSRAEVQHAGFRVWLGDSGRSVSAGAAARGNSLQSQSV